MTKNARQRARGIKAAIEATRNGDGESYAVLSGDAPIPTPVPRTGNGTGEPMKPGALLTIERVAARVREAPDEQAEVLVPREDLETLLKAAGALDWSSRVSKLERRQFHTVRLLRELTRGSARSMHGLAKAFKEAWRRELACPGRKTLKAMAAWLALEGERNAWTLTGTSGKGGAVVVTTLGKEALAEAYPRSYEAVRASEEERLRAVCEKGGWAVARP